MVLRVKSPLSFTSPPLHIGRRSKSTGFCVSFLPCPQSFSPNLVGCIRKNEYRNRKGKIISCQKEEEELQLVTSLRSRYNDILIVDTPQCRNLLLDSTYNVHSIFNKEDKWTGSYWDQFASLPAIIPDGPIAILGLGGGTCARLMLDLWPSLKLEGWEIDEILVDKAREYLGLSALEKCTQTGGVLCVHVGDALSPSATVPGGFAGIVVDLFSDGKVLPQLQEVAAWLELNNKLMPNGRIMVNCGGASANTNTTEDDDDGSNSSSLENDGLWRQNSTINTLSSSFPENLSWKKIGEGENYLALTGPFPDLDMWSAAVPDKLKLSVKQWQPCSCSNTESCVDLQRLRRI